MAFFIAGTRWQRLVEIDVARIILFSLALLLVAPSPTTVRLGSGRLPLLLVRLAPTQVTRKDRLSLLRRLPAGHTLCCPSYSLHRVGDFGRCSIGVGLFICRYMLWCHGAAQSRPIGGCCGRSITPLFMRLSGRWLAGGGAMAAVDYRLLGMSLTGVSKTAADDVQDKSDSCWRGRVFDDIR